VLLLLLLLLLLLCQMSVHAACCQPRLTPNLFRGCREETHCRFCQAAYGDWRQSLAPRYDAADVPPRPATPIMAISFEGQVHYIKVSSSASTHAIHTHQALVRNCCMACCLGVPDQAVLRGTCPLPTMHASVVQHIAAAELPLAACALPHNVLCDHGVASPLLCCETSAAAAVRSLSGCLPCLMVFVPSFVLVQPQPQPTVAPSYRALPHMCAVHTSLPQVYPGADGRARFEAQIRELIQLEEGEDFDVEFECKAPDTGALCFRFLTAHRCVSNLACFE
jgi:hypothetical protein